MKLNDLIDINLHYQNSINLGLDLNDYTKINSYIPTTTGLNFLNHFIDNMIDKNSDKSTMLIGPYGKGKSHSILVFLSLICSNDYDSIQILLDKIKTVDKELYNKLFQIREKRYLPIIVSNTRGALNQSLLSALQKALDNSGIQELILETDFKDVVQRIQDWREKYPNTYKDFCDELKIRRIPVDEFLRNLSNFNDESLTVFKEIHRNILSGAEFVTKNSLEIIDYYQNVTNAIIERYNYDGIFIVFDEFSKFLESRDSSTISLDMKIIQDLSELCNSSKNNEMYLQLVLHKPINDYLSMDKNIRNTFKGIEGRVSSYNFVTSLRNSFDLISNVLNKNLHFFAYKKSNSDVFEAITVQLDKIPAFYVELDEVYRNKKLVDGLFPLHPIAAYLLVKINEKVAQNERTLFTFLAKKSKYSLPWLMNLDRNDIFVYPPAIFDYFSELLLEEKDNITIHSITSNALSALNLIDDELHKNIIKVLALLLIINEKELLPSNYSILSAALLISTQKCKECINTLIKKDVLVQRHGGQIQFKINMNLNLDVEISNLVNTKFSKIQLKKELEKVTNTKYVYPRNYNISHAITRYYKVEFIDEEDFLNLSTVDHFFNEDNKDGLILNILRNKKENSKIISQHTLDINNDRLVVIYPKKFSEYSLSIKKLLSIEKLMNDETFVEQNHLINKELELQYEDTKSIVLDNLYNDYSLNSFNSDLFNSYNSDELNKSKRNISRNRILGDIFSELFNRYPIFNLELINKWNVIGSYKTAREKVCEKLLYKTINLKTLGTSPEDTIIKCILVETGLLGEISQSENLLHVMRIFNEFFKNESGSFIDLYRTITSPPYGIRKGVIPILIAYTLSNIDYTIIIKFKGQEIELNSSNLELINNKPEDYDFVVDKYSIEKEKYLKSLSELFDVQLSSNSYQNYKLLSSSILNWYIGLPKLTKQMIGKHEDITSRKFKLLNKHCLQMNINPRDFILETVPKIFESNDYRFINEMRKTKNILDDFINDYYLTVKKEINKVLGFEENSTLSSSVSIWISEHHNYLTNLVLSNAVKDFSLLGVTKYDNEDLLINKIAYIFTSLFIEDWSYETINLFKSQIEILKDFNEKISKSTNNTITIQIGNESIQKSFNQELDSSTELLENIIEEAISDFGDILTNEQRLALLVKIMKNYI